ncbi:uncharacterized protein LOC125477194 [Pyrus x bretschneideri]|uniref:uncharacterized protein LOC125477194 n=1 Tax=Pyrus x bretschneideri TaxID=225117 RepID=UPI00202FEFC5|nr:uncharacterized protein LOC125477194 [Pyrus x bretschneideri]
MRLFCQLSNRRNSSRSSWGIWNLLREPNVTIDEVCAFGRKVVIFNYCLLHFVQFYGKNSELGVCLIRKSLRTLQFLLIALCPIWKGYAPISSRLEDFYIPRLYLGIQNLEFVEGA